MSELSGQNTSLLSNTRLAIIGVGNMGGAIARGLISAGAFTPSNIVLCDTNPAIITSLQDSIGKTESTDSLLSAAEKADVILLAVKGIILADVLKTMSPALSSSKLILSIIAGKSTKTIETQSQADVRVIRAMPNTPAMVMEGATGIAKGKHATDDDILIAKSIFGAVGKVVEVSESLIDAVTGLSGSGPAYVFMIIEALTDAGVLQGLPRDTARILAAQTVYGAAKMAVESGEHVAKLKDQVTTPGGTTIHGLAELESHGVRAAFIDAVAAATQRSSEMG